MATGRQSRNDTADKERLSELETMRRELQEMLVKVDEQLNEIRLAPEPNGVKPEAHRDEKSKGRLWARSAREMLLDGLGDLEWPAYSRELAQLVEARFGRKILPTRFGTLAADEIAAFRSKGSGGRPVWLCFAVTADRHEPIKRLLARSDWPYERRIYALTTGRIQHLQMTKRFCELAMNADEFAVDPQMLRILAADHARDLPNVAVRRGVFELERWRDVAVEQIAELGPRDEALRKESAARLARRAEFYQLFGLPDVLEGDREPHLVESERA